VLSQEERRLKNKRLLIINHGEGYHSRAERRKKDGSRRTTRGHPAVKENWNPLYSQTNCEVRSRRVNSGWGGALKYGWGYER